MPCDIRNAREIYAKATRPYIKSTSLRVSATPVDIIQRSPDVIKPTQPGR